MLLLFARAASFVRCTFRNLPPLINALYVAPFPLQCSCSHQPMISTLSTPYALPVAYATHRAFCFCSLLPANPYKSSGHVRLLLSIFETTYYVISLTTYVCMTTSALENLDARCHNHLVEIVRYLQCWQLRRLQCSQFTSMFRLVPAPSSRQSVCLGCAKCSTYLMVAQGMYLQHTRSVLNI